MDAVVYTRSARPNPQAFEAQREACERMAAEFGYEVVSEFHDVGRTRPGLDQLLATVRDGMVSAVLVADIYRLSRTLDAFAQVMETLDEAGVPLYVVGEGRVTIPQRPVLGIMRAITDFEAEQAEEERRAEDDITY